MNWSARKVPGEGTNTGNFALNRVQPLRATQHGWDDGHDLADNRCALGYDFLRRNKMLSGTALIT